MSGRPAAGGAATHAEPPLRVLLIEDSPSDAAMVEEMLDEEWGPFVESAWTRTLTRGCSALGESAWSCVLLDLGLPDGDGIESVDEVVRAAPEVPVIVLTGRTEDALGEVAVRHGAQDYLSKGSTSRELLAQAIRYAVERKRVQEGIRSAEERFHSALDSLLDACAILTAVRDEAGSISDFRIDYVNGAACAVHRIGPENQLGARLLELLPQYLTTGLFGRYVRVVETGEPAEDEVTWPDDAGPKRRIEVRASRLDEALVVAFRDVTDRRRGEDELGRSRRELERRSEELERSNRDLEQFAYIVSHDLQEPLRMVSSYTTLLAEDLGDSLDDTARRHLEFAHDGAVRMQQLVRDLLRYSRVSRGADTGRQRVDCDQLVETAKMDLHEAIASAGATVTHDPLPTVTGMPTELRRLFTNLVGNAVKFRGDEPVHVHVGAARAGSMWRFSVADNGIGLDPAQTERIFEVFKRLHPRGRYPGTGIGLAICRKVVEHHGGRIWVESQPGSGATFWFTLPADGNDQGG